MSVEPASMAFVTGEGALDLLMASTADGCKQPTRSNALLISTTMAILRQ